MTPDTGGPVAGEGGAGAGPQPDTALFTRGRGAVITGIDLLKTFAVLTMVVDHLGYYFFPDFYWLRVIGRLSAPVWLFLIGYAYTPRIGWRFVAAAVAVTLTQFLTMNGILPLNILFSLMLLRLCMPWLSQPVFLRLEPMLLLIPILIAGNIMTLPMFEYGLYGFMFGLLGYWVRQGRKDINLRLFAAIITGLYLIGQQSGFEFSQIQLFVVAVELGLLVLLLMAQPVEIKRYPNLTGITVLSPALRFMGRYSLEIYAGHVILFTLIAFWLADHAVYAPVLVNWE
jgi:peptidoglycan/LPS O-acetylase OafA/YrhL